MEPISIPSCDTNRLLILDVCSAHRDPSTCRRVPLCTIHILVNVGLTSPFRSFRAQSEASQKSRMPRLPRPRIESRSLSSQCIGEWQGCKLSFAIRPRHYYVYPSHVCRSRKRITNNGFRGLPRLPRLPMFCFMSNRGDLEALCGASYKRSSRCSVSPTC